MEEETVGSGIRIYVLPDDARYSEEVLMNYFTECITGDGFVTSGSTSSPNLDIHHLLCKLSRDHHARDWNITPSEGY